MVLLAWIIQPSRDLNKQWMVNVEGSMRAARAAKEAGVPALLYASSVGAYSPGPKDRRVDESWPTGGTPTSYYARHKAEVERRLDRFETRSAGCPGRQDAPRPRLQEGGGAGDTAPLRRSFSSQFSRPAGAHKPRPRRTEPALPDRPLLRRGRGLQARHRQRRGAGPVQPGHRAGPGPGGDREDTGRPSRAGLGAGGASWRQALVAAQDATRLRRVARHGS